jgi:signal transduction histidine kinase
LHDKPLPDESWIRTLFSVFAGRAGAELARIRTEEHRRHLEADLERARRLESFGTIAGGIAHDFNNLLTAIIGNATLVRLDLPDASEPAKAMDDLCRAAERGRTLVQEIYNFSECGAVQIKPVLLRPLVDEVVTEIRHVGGERIRIETCVAATITVMADADKLHQVIHNLALNAAQAMGQEGKITITVSQERVEAAAAGRLSQAPGVYQTIMIEDTGPGIPATELGQIFDPFFTTKKNSGGTGLGLALVQRAVSAHGGMVTVSTQIGQGTRFTVYLPARTTEGASRPGGTSS